MFSIGGEGATVENEYRVLISQQGVIKSETPDYHHHQISGAPITLRPYVHYNLGVAALNKSLLYKDC